LRQFRRGKTQRNLELVRAFTGMSESQASAACWPLGGDDARIDTAILHGYQEWARERGLIDRVISGGELVDGRFVDVANARLKE
jgi:hypothetical protein